MKESRCVRGRLDYMEFLDTRKGVGGDRASREMRYSRGVLGSFEYGSVYVGLQSRTRTTQACLERNVNTPTQTVAHSGQLRRMVDRVSLDTIL